MKKHYTIPIAIAVAFLVTACATDAPTEVGDALLTTDDVVTFEVILPASSFLQFDSSFTGYAKPVDALFGLVARKFENTLDANSLYRFSLPPTTIQVRNSAGITVTDSAPRYFSGRMVLKIDTVVTPGAKPVLLRAFRTAEAWNETATWTNRIDSGTVRLPWQMPGGTRGPQIDTATFAAGDSIVFRVDSQTIAIWNDTTNKARGAIVIAETNGARIRILSAAVRLSARSVVRPDTVVAVDIVPSIRTFVFDPQPSPTTADLRVGGIPAWRSVLRIRPDLSSLTVPCTNGPPGCQVTVDSIHISSAQLLLRPKRSPPGFSLEDTTFVDVRPLALSPTVPLERSPIGGRVGLSRAIAPTAFANPGVNDIVTIDITSFIAQLTSRNVTNTTRLPPVLALLQIPEPGTFGFMTFEQSPSLRLVLTAAVERR